MIVLAAIALASSAPWIMVADDPGVTVYLGTQDTEIDHKRRTYKTWVRFTYHNVPEGQSNEAMTLNTFNCARNTVRTWTIIESYPNAAADVTHPTDGPEPIAPSTYYESVRDAVCYIMKTGE
jgi:hypothetical protein